PVTGTSTDPTPVDPTAPVVDPDCPDCTITDLPDDLPPPPADPDADIAIYKTISEQSAVLNEEIEFTVTVENVGAIDATNIVVSDKLPNGYNFIGVTTAAGTTYNEITGQFTINELAIGESAVFVMRVSVTNIEDYINVARLESLDQDDTDDTNNEASAGSDLVISKCFEIFNEFTPNGDGKNDYFTVRCIENYSGNTVDIYNRWGIKVYSAKDYQNNWDGVSNGRATIN
ncbi:gliding motility-associated C-terminal domain-containing protein, partial [Joostella atrarenae]